MISTAVELKPLGPDQEVGYGAVPPVIVASTVPLAAPPQVAGVTIPVTASAAAGCVMVTLRVVEHPLASVMVQVHDPKVRLFAVALFCTGTVFQL